jgi:hypothetical protein
MGFKMTKCILVRKIKGIGNAYILNNDEFVITNDDTHEIWQRNNENMRDFKAWYSQFCDESKMTGSYPKYDVR